ncbi:PilT protein domain protein [Desulfofundulus kuznetsovii DSM 6115]|uniref:PilT protein domain protein n=1 Tax=Desulfofundulus kuznetsovii (strain DSM 6115 / VKM B-1805 / 17) TaxID=760568 RepID=A0AAU8PFX7_DESK7|nr:PilT protein domain protein [Desulfofundulus kuznetsovii DSM 6115]
MIYLWIDANVVLRFLTGNPPEMAAQALELMARAEKGEVCLRLHHLVIAEIVWVLSSFYKFTKREIANTLVSFIHADGIQVDNSDLVVQALQDMAKKNIDFVDAYLAALAKQHEESVCSFDSDFEKLNVSLVKPPGYPQEK